MKNANIKKAQEIAQRFVSKRTKDLPANKILTHQIETACIEMANWKDELIGKFKHHADSMYTEMMNLSTDASQPTPQKFPHKIFDFFIQNSYIANIKINS